MIVETNLLGYYDSIIIVNLIYRTVRIDINVISFIFVVTSFPSGNRYRGMWCHGKHKYISRAEIVLGDELLPYFAVQVGLATSSLHMNVVCAPKGMKQQSDFALNH